MVDDGISLQAAVNKAVEQYLSQPGPAATADELASLRADPVFGPMLAALMQAWKAKR